MSFLHSREYLNVGDIVEVDCSHQCNVMLLDDSNFRHYQNNDNFSYYGGFCEKFPARIGVPSSGNWNIVIDLGGGTANIRYSINIIRAG